MKVARIDETVKNKIYFKYIILPAEYNTGTHVNCVRDCDFNWFTTLVEINCYIEQYNDEVEYEEVDYCAPCIDEDLGEQIPCN